MSKFLNDHYYRLGNADHDQGSGVAMLGEEQLNAYLTRTNKEQDLHNVRAELFPNNHTLVACEAEGGLLDAIDAESHPSKNGNGAGVLELLNEHEEGAVTARVNEALNGFGLFSLRHSKETVDYNEEHLLRPTWLRFLASSWNALLIP